MKLWTKPKMKKRKEKRWSLRRSSGRLWGRRTPPTLSRGARKPSPPNLCQPQRTCTNPLATGSNWNTFLYIAIHRPGPLPSSSFPLLKLTFQPLDVSAFQSFDAIQRATSVVFEPPFICKGFIWKSFFLGGTKNKRFHLSFDPISSPVSTRRDIPTFFSEYSIIFQ